MQNGVKFTVNIVFVSSLNRRATPSGHEHVPHEVHHTCLRAVRVQLLVAEDVADGVVLELAEERALEPAQLVEVLLQHLDACGRSSAPKLV